MSFADTKNKATIRRLWDRVVLESWRQKQKRDTLTYFGLPGPDICDLLDWKNVLDRLRSGVESLGHTKQEQIKAQEDIGRLSTNLFIAGIGSGFQLLRGDIEDIIIDGLDHDGNRPQINDGRPAHAAHFEYDVVNLDFDGGIGYREASGAAKRVTAIKKLFERQEGHSFVLFLTINVRDTMGSEIEDYLRGLQIRDRGPSWRDTLAWYLDRADGEREYKLKATVPSFIHAISEARVFQCMSRPPIAYEGYERAHMIHFAFELEAMTPDGRSANLRGFSLQDDLDLIELPFLRCEDGQLRIASMQHPGFDYTRCSTNLNFLPEEIRDSILTPAHSRIITEM
jgi:hypothetical protein